MSLLKLPHWSIIDKFPAFYDTESATAIEMTGKLYAKINELIEAHEKWVDDVNAAIEKYEAENDKDYSCFTKTIVKLTSDYIGMVDLKIIQHDRKFDEYYKSFTSEIVKTTEKIISDLKANGELDAAILKAVDELETKFETFKNEVSATVAELRDTALVFKEKIDLQYNNFVEQTERAAENLETDYAETKAALETDYAETKAALDTDYQNTKAALDTDYQNINTDLYNSFGHISKAYRRYTHFICIYGNYGGDEIYPQNCNVIFACDDHYNRGGYSDIGGGLSFPADGTPVIIPASGYVSILDDELLSKKIEICAVGFEYSEAANHNGDHLNLFAYQRSVTGNGFEKISDINLLEACKEDSGYHLAYTIHTIDKED